MFSSGLKTVLPTPQQSSWDREEVDKSQSLPFPQQQKQLILHASSRNANIPPYGQRKSWIPRSIDDFGDGGAFPEIHVAQYPLDLGRKQEKKSNALPVQLDAEGKIKYD